MPNGLSQSEYAKRLQAYLNNQMAQGFMSPAQAQSVWQTASIRAGRGDLIPDLPYYEQVQEIWLKPITPTYPKDLPTTGYRERYAQYEAVSREAQAQAQRRPRETTLQALRRMEAWLGQAGRVDVRPSEKMQHPWLPVYQQIKGIERGLGIEGLAREEAYPVGEFEKERAGLTGAKPWRDWYESKFQRELGRFRAGLPYGEPLPGKRWSEYLRRRKPELKEEYAILSPWQRGERPGVFQPRIKTVRF